MTMPVVDRNSAEQRVSTPHLSTVAKRTVVIAVGDRDYAVEVANALCGHRAYTLSQLPCDVASTVSALQWPTPDLAIVDEELPGGGARAVLATLAELGSATDVLVLAGSPDSGTMAELIARGAAGYVSCGHDVPGLLLTIDCAMRGDILLSRGSFNELIQRPVTAPPPEPEALRMYLSLTRRERDVLGLLAEGLHPHAIANELGITSNTARTHIQHVIQKLGVHSAVEAATRAIDTGLIEMWS